MQSPIVHLDASNPAGYSGANAVNLATGVQWTMKGDSTWCNRTMHNGVAVFDMENPACHLETTERISYCNEGTGFGYTTATWIDWRDEDWRNYRVLHQPEGDEFVTAVYPRSSRLGVMSSDGGWRDGGGYWHPANVLTEGWSLVIAVGQDTDCAADGGVGGTTTFYIGAPSARPRLKGIADRSPASGRATLYLGGPSNRGPGRVAETWAWDRALTPAQVHAFWSQTHTKYS